MNVQTVHFTRATGESCVPASPFVDTGTRDPLGISLPRQSAVFSSRCSIVGSVVPDDDGGRCSKHDPSSMNAALSAGTSCDCAAGCTGRVPSGTSVRPAPRAAAGAGLGAVWADVHVPRSHVLSLFASGSGGAVVGLLVARWRRYPYSFSCGDIGRSPSMTGVRIGSLEPAVAASSIVCPSMLVVCLMTILAVAPNIIHPSYMPYSC